MISMEYNVLWVALLWASIVLFNLAIKWVAGFLLNTPAEPVGKAVLNVAL
jgi:hypothetical protein